MLVTIWLIFVANFNMHTTTHLRIVHCLLLEYHWVLGSNRLIETLEEALLPTLFYLICEKFVLKSDAIFRDCFETLRLTLFWE